MEKLEEDLRFVQPLNEVHKYERGTAALYNGFAGGGFGGMGPEPTPLTDMDAFRSAYGGIAPKPLDERSYGDQSPIESDVLGEDVELDQGYNLGVRLDFSGHKRGDPPHINLDLLKGPLLKLDKNSKSILGKDHFIHLNINWADYGIDPTP